MKLLGINLMSVAMFILENHFDTLLTAVGVLSLAFLNGLKAYQTYLDIRDKKESNEQKPAKSKSIFSIFKFFKGGKS